MSAGGVLSPTSLGVTTVSLQGDSHRLARAVAPEPAVIAVEGGFKNSAVLGRAAALFIAGAIGAPISMHVEVHLRTVRRPGVVCLCSL